MKLSKEEQEKLLNHFGKTEAEGEYDDTVVAQDSDGKDVTIGEIRKAQGGKSGPASGKKEPGTTAERSKSKKK